MQTLVEQLLGSSDIASVDVSDFATVLRKQTKTEFSTILVPAMLRSLRRSATKTMVTINTILELSRADMSQEAPELVSVLLDSWKSVDLLPVVSSSIALVFRKCESEQVQSVIFKLICDTFPKLGQLTVDIAVSSIVSAMFIDHASADLAVEVLDSALLVSLIKQLKSLGTSDEVKRVVATAVCAMIGSAVSSAPTSCSTIVQTELVSVLVDKKTSESVKESLLLGIERICAKDTQKSISVPLDSVVPFLTFLSNGRLTMRATCLASWVVLFHSLGASTSVDKKLLAIFTTCVATDVTFGLPEDSSLEIKYLLRRLFTLALTVKEFPVISETESETIVLPVVSTRMTNRFLICLIRAIAGAGLSQFEWPSIPQLPNRLVQALYECIVDGHYIFVNARKAIIKMNCLYSKMDPEWQSLFVVLCHQQGVPTQHVPPVESLLSLCFNRGGVVGIPDGSGFRAACLKSLMSLDKNIVTERALSFVSAAPSFSPEEASVYFQSPKVVWRDNVDLAWIPTSDNTTVSQIAPKTSNTHTKEDLLFLQLKEQSLIRNRVSQVISQIQFCLEILAKLVDLQTVERIIVSDDWWLKMLRSRLFGGFVFKLICAVSEFAGNIGEKSIIPKALYGSNMCTDDELIRLFESIVSESEMGPVERALMEPVFEIGTHSPHNDVQSATLVAYLTTRTESLSLSKVLKNLCTLSKNTNTHVNMIGKILIRISPQVSTQEDINQLCEIGQTNDPKLFAQVLAALAHVDSPSPIVHAMRLMGGDLSSPITPMIEDELLKIAANSSHTLMHELASESLSKSGNCVCIFTQSVEMYRSDSNCVCGMAYVWGALGKQTLNGGEITTNLVDFIIGTVLDSNLSMPPHVVEKLFLVLSESITQNGEPFAQNLIALISEKYVGKTNCENSSLAVPIVLGLLCKFLPISDPKVATIRTQLISELLSSPNASVQSKIASILPPLLKLGPDEPDLGKYVETFLNSALNTIEEAARYGAALGVGAAVKAQGVSILRQFDVLKRVEEAARQTSVPKKRQGAIAVYGGLSLSLGRLFEPYVSQVLPVLLVAFSDNQIPVRESAQTAAGQIMANLSTHGIKLVLPSLLAGIEDMQWRTKLGSIQLLSAMINCGAPKQLAQCLPKIVPALSEVATDTHAKVKEAAGTALVAVGKVIANPEIQSCAHKLIASLRDPANDSLRQDALDTLLGTSFVHSLDAASLALVIPVMLRATRERRSEMKRKGAQILGSIAVLSADPVEGLGPYMSKIVPALQEVLIDPIPDVRATAAKAMGTMARALPDVMVAEVLPWLFTTLKTAESQVERSGAAHGLSEVLVELGAEHFSSILPEVVNNALSPATTPEAREGYLGLFVFLPGVMKNAFVPFIDSVFPLLVGGLSDPHQPVREVALRAATALCTQFASTHATLLMPSFEAGLFARDWRARQASGQLTGLTLEQLMKNSRGNKDNLLECQVPLTQERRSYMLAMLYIIRSDPNQYVNQCAQQVWKNVVSNTPRTLRLILPILVRLIINNLSSNEEETRQLLAGRCLGDLVSKLGERVLPDLMPTLIENIHSNDPLVRTGFCIGLAEIVKSAHRQQLQEYFSIMFPAIRIALCDSDLNVRDRAGTLVSTLHVNLGNTTVNSTLPYLLDSLAEKTEPTVLGLVQLVKALPREMVPQIIATLVPPYTSHQLRGLETVHAAPNELSKHVATIVPFLTNAFTEIPESAIRAANVLFPSFHKQAAHLVITLLIEAVGSTNGQIREASVSLICVFIKVAQIEVISEYIEESLIPLLLNGMLADEYLPAMEASIVAFNELVTRITKEGIITHMDVICECVHGGSGLSVPKVFEGLWPIYQQALMFGTPNSRELAAKGLVVLIEETPVDRLKPNAIKITGPLIRVLGDRYPSSVRIPLLKCLQILLVRLEAALKPFLPQLQTTYQKCAQDSDPLVVQIAQESQNILSNIK